MLRYYLLMWISLKQITFLSALHVYYWTFTRNTTRFGKSMVLAGGAMFQVSRGE